MLLIIWSIMLSSSRYVLSKLSETTSPEKLFRFDYITLYTKLAYSDLRISFMYLKLKKLDKSITLSQTIFYRKKIFSDLIASHCTNICIVYNILSIHMLRTWYIIIYYIRIWVNNVHENETFEIFSAVK